MSLQIAIVGLPNVGKSTLFNALMKRAQAEAANHPFTTIEPNVGIVDLPDDRLEKIAEIAKPEKIVPATVTFVDIAGLIAGAHKGEGLGNQFLSHIREADAIALVLRCFRSDNIIHVAGKVDPVDDAKTVLLELILADLAVLQKRIDALEGEVRKDPTSSRLRGASEKGAKERLALAKAFMAALENEQLASSVSLSDEQAILAKELQLLTLKPFLYVANVAEEDAAKTAEEVTNEWSLRQLDNSPKGVPSGMTSKLIPISAKVEAEVAELDEAEATEYLESLGLKQPGLNRLIHAGFDLLDLATYFTAGPKEVRAWTIKKGMKAPEAAGVIHGDFAKGFIRAEVISYSDYIAYSGETGAKQAGRFRSEGKDYVVEDGDVMHFRFSV